MTHAAHLMRFADRVIIMDKGQITFSGSFKEAMKKSLIDVYEDKQEEQE